MLSIKARKQEKAYSNIDLISLVLLVYNQYKLNIQIYCSDNEFIFISISSRVTIQGKLYFTRDCANNSCQLLAS